MKTMRDLFRFSGEVSRRRYVITGLLLFTVKYALDYLLTAVVFHRQWKWYPYLAPLGEISGLTRLAGADQLYAASMLAVALPFIWIGLAMTSRRIRSAG